MADDLFSVEGKRILLTGGAAGIGRMLSEGLAERGARIFTASRKQAVLDELTADLRDGRGYDVATTAADLGDMEQVERVAREAGEHFGGTIDVLINNAGCTWGDALEDFPLDKGWDRVMDLNLKGLFHLSRLCVPMLKKGGTADDPARIVNFASVSGFGLTPPNVWSYWPSKAAVLHLTRAFAKELAGDGVNVNAVAPGLFPSRMTDYMFDDGDTSEVGGGIPVGRVGRPSDMVGTVVYLISKASAFTTGTHIVVDGGGLLH